MGFQYNGKLRCAELKVPVRQWVLSFPIALRSLFAVHPELLAPVLQIIHRVIATHLIKQAGIKRQAASCTYRIALGPRAGRKVLSLQYAASRAAPITQPLCANAHGFSLHAGVRCAAEQRSELEHLCRYITRPAIANEG